MPIQLANWYHNTRAIRCGSVQQLLGADRQYSPSAIHPSVVLKYLHHAPSFSRGDNPLRMEKRNVFFELPKEEGRAWMAWFINGR